MKKAYGIYFIGYLVLLIVKLVYYFAFPSNLFGLIYFIISSIIVFLLALTYMNYKSSNKKIRISKNTLLVLLMIFISYVLPKLDYYDESLKFIDNMYAFLYIVDSFYIFALIIITFVELEFTNKKIKKNYN